METPSAYTSIISPRSRRLRTIGIVLLVAICAMVIYGYFGLMPSVTRAVHEAGPASVSTDLRPGTSPANPPMTRAQRVRKLQIAVAMAYWGVCGLLIVSVIFVAWLDLREISRHYLMERKAIWNQTAGNLDDQDESS